jgi:hypothetical protein
MSLYSKITKAICSPFSREEAKVDPADALRDMATEFAVQNGPVACSELLAKLLVAMVFESKKRTARFDDPSPPSLAFTFSDGAAWEFRRRGKVDVEVSGQWTQIGTPERKDDSWLL